MVHGRRAFQIPDRHKGQLAATRQREDIVHHMSLPTHDPLARRQKRDRHGDECPSLPLDDDKHSKKRKVNEQEGSETHKLFACPYYKRSPTRWDKPPCRSREGWKNVARLKQHLQETHFKQICERCRCLFETEAELKAHAVAKEGCDPQEETDYVRGFGTSIQEKLRSRRMGRGKSQFEYWQTVYVTLFPDVLAANVPSPYCTPFNVHDWYHQCRDHRSQDERLRSRLRDIIASGRPLDVIIKSILTAVDESDLGLIRMADPEYPSEKSGPRSSISGNTSLGTRLWSRLFCTTSHETSRLLRTHATMFTGAMDGHAGQDDGQITIGLPSESMEDFSEESSHLESFGEQMVGTSGPVLVGQPQPADMYPTHGFSAMVDPRELQLGFTHVAESPHGGQNVFHPQSENTELVGPNQGHGTDTTALHLQYPTASVHGPFIPLLQDDNCHHQATGPHGNAPTDRTLGLAPRQEAIAEVAQAFNKYDAAFKGRSHNL